MTMLTRGHDAAASSKAPGSAASRMEPCRSLSRQQGTELTRSRSGGERFRHFREPLEGQARSRSGKGTAGSLGQCLREYEALEELIGRIVSYASLVYAGNTTDPSAKTLRRCQEKMTGAAPICSSSR